VPGHCDKCENERLAQLKKCKDLQLASMKRGVLPDDAEPELEMPAEEGDLFDQEDDRERYP